MSKLLSHGYVEEKKKSPNDDDSSSMAKSSSMMMKKVVIMMVKKMVTLWPCLPGVTSEQTSTVATEDVDDLE